MRPPDKVICNCLNSEGGELLQHDFVCFNHLHEEKLIPKFVNFNQILIFNSQISIFCDIAVLGQTDFSLYYYRKS